jgi:hypothetical protein
VAELRAAARQSCVAPRTADLRVVAGGGIVARMMFADWRPFAEIAAAPAGIAAAPAGIAAAPAGARARIEAWRRGRP